jgi:hypothetical protein
MLRRLLRRDGKGWRLEDGRRVLGFKAMIAGREVVLHPEDVQIMVEHRPAEPALAPVIAEDLDAFADGEKDHG